MKFIDFYCRSGVSPAVLEETLQGLFDPVKAVVEATGEEVTSGTIKVPDVFIPEMCASLDWSRSVLPEGVIYETSVAPAGASWAVDLTYYKETC